MRSQFDDEELFDDDDIREMLEQMGGTHDLGMADDVLRQLSPLLAAEGIDVDDLDGVSDEDFDAAMASATERFNMETFTPTGDDLTGALEILNECAEVISEGNTDLVGVILDAVRPQPVGDWPAITHVIGAALGRLDELGVQPELRKAFTAAKVPRSDWQATKIAKDILRRARRGKAFASIDDFSVEYDFLATLHGAALAYAGVMNALAGQWGVSVTEVIERLGIPRDVRMGFAISFAKVDEKFALDFAEWMESSLDELDLEEEDADPLADDAVPDFAGAGTLLFVMVRSQGLDPHDPGMVGEVVDALSDLMEEDESTLLDFMSLLDNYVHFRMDTADDPSVWEEGHELVEAYLSVAVAAFEGEVEAIEQLETASPEVRKAALLVSLPVAGIPALLEWLETGPKCTASGGLRRADIRQVAAMIGIDAVGCNEFPEYDPDDDVRYARSMDDIPELWAWFESLRFSDILDSVGTRFVPGKDAHLWRHPEERELLEIKKVVGFLVTMLIVGDRQFELGSPRFSLGGSSIYSLGKAIEFQPALDAAPIEKSYPKPRKGQEPFRPMPVQAMKTLGLLDWNSAGEIVVPEPLKPMVGRALMSAILWYRELR